MSAEAAAWLWRPRIANIHWRSLIAPKNIRMTLLVAAILTAAAVAIVVYRWHSFGFKWSLFTATLVDINAAWLWLALILCMATYLGRALRWRIMILPIKPEPNLWNILVGTVIGFTAIVLFGRPGELVRPYLIAASEKISFSSQIAAWTLERIYDLLVVLLIFGISLSQISRSRTHFGPVIGEVLRIGGYLIGIVGFICLLLLFFFNRLSGDFGALSLLPPAWHSRVSGFLHAFSQGMESTRNLGFIIKVLVYSLLEWAIITASIVCLFRAFPATANFRLMDVFVFLGFVAFGSAIQIPGIGGGMQLTSILIFTEFFHFSIEVATSLALVVWVFSFVVIMPFGLVLAFHKGIRWRNLRESVPESPAL